MIHSEEPPGRENKEVSHYNILARKYLVCVSAILTVCKAKRAGVAKEA